MSLFITDTTDEDISTDSSGISENYGFIPNADGAIELQARNDAADRTVHCLAGHWYKIDVKSFTAVGTTATQALIVNEVRRV